MNSFTRSDLSCAGTILACKDHKCSRTGEPMFSDSFIAWAKLVMKTFAREAWSVVRSAGLSLSEAWSQVKSMGTGSRKGRTVFIPMGMTGRKLVRAKTNQLIKVLTMVLIALTFGLTSCSVEEQPVPYGWTQVYNTDDYADTTQVQVRQCKGLLAVNNRIFLYQPTIGGWRETLSGQVWDMKTIDGDVILYQSDATIMLIPDYSQPTSEIK
ncbi:MAG: hypothetical protein H6546_02835 [Chitinophagales bacterium]|nr:hypothetical protein [Chitinophagales bacterium]